MRFGKKQCRYCRLAAEQGGIPLVSHLLFAQFPDGSKAVGRRRGLRMVVEMLKLCGERWGSGEPAEGMRMESTPTGRLGIPVHWSDKVGGMANE